MRTVKSEELTKEAEYPCGVCGRGRKNHGGADSEWHQYCARYKVCPRWKKWFGGHWSEIRRLFGFE